jgi:hypothetical protein
MILNQSLMEPLAMAVTSKALGNNDWVEDNSKLNFAGNFRAQDFSSFLDKLYHIPLGIPPLRTDQRHGMSSTYECKEFYESIVYLYLASKLAN